MRLVDPLLIVLLIVAIFLAIWVYKLRVRVRDQTAREMAFTPSLLISPEEAQAGAQRGFEGFGLLQRQDWRSRLWDDTRHAPRPLRQPLLVQRLDDKDDVYYLVPVGSSDGAIEAAARVDGLSGEYLEASAFVPGGPERSWGSMIADWRTEADTRRLIAGRRADREHHTATSTGAGSVRVHPSFVWKPCVESRSPFYPFRLVAIGDRQRYVRIDGKEFDSLTDLGPGSLGGESSRLAAHRSNPGS